MLAEARKVINEIDDEMIVLFKRRMEEVKKVLVYKKENNLEVLDSSREKEIIEKNINNLNNKDLEKYYQIFFEGVLKSSKSFQEDNYE